MICNAVALTDVGDVEGETFDPDSVSLDFEQAYSDKVITMKMKAFFTGWIGFRM